MKIQIKAFFLTLLVCPIFFGVASAADRPTTLKLLFDDRAFTLNFVNQPSLLEAEPKHYVRVGEMLVPLDFATEETPAIDSLEIETALDFKINRSALENFFKRNISLVDPESDPVELKLNENGWVSIIGFPKSGYVVDFAVLELLINQALSHDHKYVRVPATEQYSSVVAEPALVDRGIKEVIAMGHSNFRGSSAARVQNIRVAARKYSGMILEQGKQFSFNQILGSVDPADGFVEELVIKGNDTEKEFGGGVCQVSTTVYRAAFEGGLQIDNRRNHSYAVPYYKPHGMDATIYLGGQDFRFTNDTPGDLLIQAVVYGENIYFVFYGTDDGRKVKTEGPFISNHRPAPEPIIEETNLIPAGTEAVLSDAHNGFDTQWVRTISRPASADPQREVFNSYYKAWPAKIARGIAPVPIAPLYPDYSSLEDSTFAD